MSGNNDVRTITMTPLQLGLAANAVSKYIALEKRDFKRFSADSPEYGDIERVLSALQDLHGTIITQNDHTLAALSLLGGSSVAGRPGDVHLEELDHV